MIAHPAVTGLIAAVVGAILVFLFFPLAIFTTIGTLLVVGGFFAIGSCYRLWPVAVLGVLSSLAGFLLLFFAHGM